MWTHASYKNKIDGTLVITFKPDQIAEILQTIFQMHLNDMSEL